MTARAARRSFMLRVRLSVEEKFAVREMARRLNTSTSEIVRQLLRRAAGLPCTYDEVPKKAGRSEPAHPATAIQKKLARAPRPDGTRIPLDVLHSSPRLVNLLSRALRVRYLDQITWLRRSEVLKVKGLGRGSFEELRELLASHGLRLRDDDAPVRERKSRCDDNPSGSFKSFPSWCGPEGCAHYERLEAAQKTSNGADERAE